MKVHINQLCDHSQCAFRLVSLQMPRRRTAKKKRLLWDPCQMATAVKSVISGDLSLRGASALYHIPLGTLHDRVRKEKESQMGLIPRVTGKIGHPTVLSEDMENALVNRLVYFENRGLGLTPMQVKRAAFDLAVACDVRHAWNVDVKLAGDDWFKAFMKRHPNISLRKPEGLSRARAAGMNEQEVRKYFSILKGVMTDFNLFDKPQCIYNVDETGIPLNNRPVKIVSQRGKREVVSLTNVEKGENVTVVACCNAAGSYIPPMIVFKGVRMRPEFNDGLPPCTIVELSESGYINERLFLRWLEHFATYKTPGRVLLILDNHGSHTNFNALKFCQENEIELVGLPPHTTHVLQPLDRTLFKSLKAHYYRKATNWQHRHPNETLSKIRFNTLFCEAWNEAASVGSAIKGFACTGIMPFSDDIVPKEKFAPSFLFVSSSDENNPSTSNVEATAICVPETSKKDDSPMPDSQDHDKPTTFSITPNPSDYPIPEGDDTPTIFSPTSTSSDSPENALVRNILKTPEKKPSTRKRKLLTSLHLTSNAHIVEVQAKKSSTDNRPTQGKKKLQNTTRKPQRSKALTPANEDLCGFCHLSYYSKESYVKGAWIQCQSCTVWYHDVCVGAQGRKQFICGKCL